MIRISLALLFSLSSFASSYRVERVRTLGPLKTKVIFQSKDLKKIKRSNVLKGKLVTQWGTDVFEVVQGFYSCNSKNFCRLTDFERIATYKKCVVKKNIQVECQVKLGGGSSSALSASSEIIILDNPDSVSDEFSRRNLGDESETDFPARVQDEFDGIL
jgi:hypothetical protein